MVSHAYQTVPVADFADFLPEYLPLMQVGQAFVTLGGCWTGSCCGCLVENALFLGVGVSPTIWIMAWHP